MMGPAHAAPGGVASGNCGKGTGDKPTDMTDAAMIDAFREGQTLYYKNGASFSAAGSAAFLT